MRLQPVQQRQLDFRRDPCRRRPSTRCPVATLRQGFHTVIDKSTHRRQHAARRGEDHVNLAFQCMPLGQDVNQPA